MLKIEILRARNGLRYLQLSRLQKLRKEIPYVRVGSNYRPLLWAQLGSCLRVEFPAQPRACHPQIVPDGMR